MRVRTGVDYSAVRDQVTETTRAGRCLRRYSLPPLQGQEDSAQLALEEIHDSQSPGTQTRAQPQHPAQPRPFPQLTAPYSTIHIQGPGF